MSNSFYESHSYNILGLYQNNHSYCIMSFSLINSNMICFTKRMEKCKKLYNFEVIIIKASKYKVWEKHILLDSFPFIP